MPAKMIVNKSEIISVTKSAYYFFLSSILQPISVTTEDINLK